MVFDRLTTRCEFLIINAARKQLITNVLQLAFCEIYFCQIF